MNVSNRNNHVVKAQEEKNSHIEVPHIAAGLPIIILSDTPEILSFFPYADASNK